MYRLYSGVLAALLLAYLPVFIGRRGAQGVHLAERLGHLRPGLPAEPRCWIHAVSVGEAAAVVPLVEGIRSRWPDLGIVLTTVTPTGARIATDRLGGRVTHRYFPVDLPGPVGKALDAVRPRFFIGMETELWPNLLRALGRRGIPCMIANGRISDRSFRRYRWVRFAMARILRSVSIFGMQSAEDARRIISLGAPPERVAVTGNLKSDLSTHGAGGEEKWERLLGVGAGDPVWIAGSTHRGEEEILLEVFQRLRPRLPGLTLMLAPRHPERVHEVQRLVRARGLNAVRRTELPCGRDGSTVVVLDTVGELAEAYGIAQVVFVGGSLVPRGGHNMLEVAARRKPALFGPHTENFRESADLLVSAGAALVVRDGDDLERALGRLLKEPGLRAAMGEAGFGAVASRQGAVQETLKLVERHLYGQAAR